MLFFRKTKLGRSYRHIIRYKQFIAVLLKHGFNDFVDNNNLIKSIKIRKRKILQKEKHKKDEIQSHDFKAFTHWERIRMVVEDLGPTFIKLGQFLSNRPDLIPQELCEEFEKLLDNVAPFDGQRALQIVETELKAKKNQIFADFEIKPFSSASMAQVHRAHLLNGQKVAVKIQRPGISSKIESDLEIMLHLAELVKKHIKGADVINPVGLVQEFKDGLESELDFKNEALNLEKFTRLFKDDDTIVVPKVYKEFSSSHVLVMEFIDGQKILDFSHGGGDKELITSRLANLVLKQIFEYGFFHADPHAANLLVTNDNKVCFVDFGLMGMLPPKHKAALCEIIIGLVEHDPDRITKAILRMSLNKEIENRSEIEHKVFKIIEDYAYLPIEDINVSYFLRDLLVLLVYNRLIIPSDIFLLLKTLIALEGTVRKIKQDFDMITHVEPFVKAFLYKNANVLKFLKDLGDAGVDYARLLIEFPNELREIIDMLKNKKMKIQFEHKGLEPMTDKLDQIMNRLAYSIITAALLIGSSLILRANIPPYYYGFSGPGLLLFMFSSVMGIFLLITIIRHGKM